MTSQECPQRDQLFDYAVGRLPDDRSEDLAEHLDDCHQCQAELATLDDADDTLVARLRLPVRNDPILAESQCEVAVARAREAVECASSRDRSAGNARSNSLAQMDLGEYRLLELLGRGGMGTVYRAVHTKLDRIVALKVLADGRAADDSAIARFEREMRAIGRLDHPHIVRAFDAREIADRPVLVMEYIDGFDLGKLVHCCGPLSVADACELTRQAAFGLQCAHENGLVHRDVKPSNLMLTRDGVVKLLDLGLARFREPVPGDDVTGTGQAMGTADYMAPEQTSDSHAVDIRADIYSLGCTLYKLLTGQAPFAVEPYRGAFDKMTAHVNEPIPSVQTHCGDVPAELVGVLDRMLAKAPNQRFATPADLAAALEPFCVGCDPAGLWTAASASSAIHSASPGAYSAKTPPAGHDASLPKSSSRWNLWTLLATATIFGAAAGLALGIVLTVRKDGQQVSIHLPDRSRAEISSDGNVQVDLDDDSEQPADPAAALHHDFSDIQGVWRVVSAHDRGRPFPAREVEDTHAVIDKDAVDLYIFDRKVGLGRYAIDPNADPKKIDLIPGDHAEADRRPGVFRGIYTLDGKQLKVCYNEDRRGARANRFVTELDSPNTMLMLFEKTDLTPAEFLSELATHRAPARPGDVGAASAKEAADRKRKARVTPEPPE